MRIAIFHLGFFYAGGGEKLVLEEAAELEKRGHQVSLFAPVVDKRTCFPDLIKKAKVYPLLPFFSFRFPLRDFLAIMTAVFLTPLTFWRFVKFDLFFGANQPGALISFCLAMILKKPYVVYVAQPTRLIYPRLVDREGFAKGSFDIFFFLISLFRPLAVFLDRISIQNAKAILVNGQYMAEALKKVYQSPMVVCPAGCYPAKDLPGYQNRWRRSRPFILLTNRHFPQKKFEYAVQALAAIQKEFPRLGLVITGSPTAYTQEIKKLVRKMGLLKKVHFLGLVSEKRLTRLYRQAVLYLYSSPEEDFGMGVIEAMAAGTPVVAWNYAGPTATVIDGVTGFLAKPYQLKDFQAKALKLLREPKLAARFGRAGWQRAKEFAYRKHVGRLEEVFGECVGKQ